MATVEDLYFASTQLSQLCRTFSEGSPRDLTTEEQTQVDTTYDSIITTSDLFKYGQANPFAYILTTVVETSATLV